MSHGVVFYVMFMFYSYVITTRKEMPFTHVHIEADIEFKKRRLKWEIQGETWALTCLQKIE